MRPAIPNPAWSNCALLRAWEAIEAHVGPGAMPKVTKHTVDALKAVEYGHGSYGVVMPTQGARGWICKVTSDESEGHFVAVYRSLSRKPEGIVRYGPIFELPTTRRGNKVYILWREEAFDVGKVFGKSEDDQIALSLTNAMFDETIPTCQIACRTDAPPGELEAVRRSATHQRGRTGYEDGGTPAWWQNLMSKISFPTAKAGRGFAVAQELATDLEEIPKFRAIGRAMLELMKQGVLITDVHDGNFGYVKRKGRRLAVITDPGNVAFLTTKFDKLEPKSVLSGLPANVRAQVEQSTVRCAH